MIKFNQRQISAFAAICDNVATAALIGVIIGSFVESKVEIIDAAILVFFTIVLVASGAVLRSGDEK